MSTIQNLRKSLDRNCLQCGRGCSLWGRVCPFPLPLLPTSGGDGDGLVRCRLALLWNFSVPLFCEGLAVCSGWLIFSLAIAQFKKAPSDCSQGLWPGPYPKQCHLLLFVPPPCWWRRRASGVLFCGELLLGT